MRFGDGAEQDTPRLQLLFVGEDPEQHADRVEAAVTRRLEAQARAKFNFVIDNMPADDLPVPSSFPSSAAGRVSKIGKILQIFGGLVLGCIKTKFCKKICV